MPKRGRSRRGLTTWLTDTVTPLFVLDARRKVLFFNRGCEQLTGWSAGDVIGQVCDYVSEPDYTQVECLTGSLCPPPDVLAGQEQSVPTFVMTRTGEKLTRMARFVPLVDDDGTVSRILGSLAAIVDQKKLVATPHDRQLHAELAAIRGDLRKRYDVTSLVGQSAVFRRILRQVEAARQSRISIHFEGEAGTGREHIARLIHYQSPDRLRAFVPVDCARMTADRVLETLEYVLTEAAEGEIPHLRPGTVFFRSADRLPADVQQMLVERWSRADPPSVRLMSDSIESLDRAVSEDRLRESCFHLLTSLVIRIPPLRERMEDFSLLAQDMLERHNRDRESQITGFSDEVWGAFRAYNWPGNQDELQQVIREARDACQGKLIVLGDLPFRFRTGQEAQRIGPARTAALQPLDERLEDVEREHIREALALAGQNKSQAAERLGITRPKLYRRMRQLGLADGVVDDDGA